VNFRRLFQFPWRSRQQIDADVNAEFQFHIDSRIAELVAQGVSEREARASALRQFGDIDDARSYIKSIDRRAETERRRSETMREFMNDFIYGARKLWAAPTFALTVIVTLALGIGATTAIFSVVNSVLLKPMPYPDADRLVRFQFRQQGNGDAGTPMDLTDYGTQVPQLEGMSVVEGGTVNIVTPAGEPDRALGVQVGANFFTLLRTKPLHGRFFLDGEDKQGAPDVAVIGEGIWRRVFGADPAIIGQSIRVNNRPMTVVGIVRAGEQYPLMPEIWSPRRFTTQEMSDGSRGARWLGYMARVKDGASMDAALQQLARVSEANAKRFPNTYTARTATLTPVQQFAFADVRRPLFVMLAATGLVLLIACANVANLMLVRGSVREGELAIRSALGAGRGRLVRQLIAESLVLTVLGAAGGLALARVGMSSLLGMAPPHVVMMAGQSLDNGALLLSGAVALLTALVFGVLPAMQIKRTDVSAALRAGTRGSKALPHANRVRRVIIAAEVAVAVTLLSGAGVLMRSFQRLVNVDPGFKPAGVMSLRVQLPQQGYATADKQWLFATQLRDKMAAIPGAQAVSLSEYLPLDGGGFGFNFVVRGAPPLRPQDQPGSEVRRVMPEFFDVLGIPVQKGRAFSADDRLGAPDVIIVNAEFARRHFANEDPVGKAVQIGWGANLTNDPDVYRTIVGVVGDVKANEVAAPPDPTIYVPMAQRPVPRLSVAIRSAVPPATLATAARKAVRELDGTMPVFAVRTMEEMVAGSISRQKFVAVLIGIFAAVALVLAAVGLYGVIAYGVSQRTHEMGVRVALGATRESVSGMIVREGLTVTAAGLVVGLGVAVLSSGVLKSLLYEVKPTDPVTLAAVAAVLVLVAALASYLPARRAARVDPIIAMRGD
jgi:putative ABC transport system permease protein